MKVSKAIPKKGKWMIWVMLPNNPPSHMADIYMDSIPIPESILNLKVKNCLHSQGWLTVIYTESNERKV